MLRSILIGIDNTRSGIAAQRLGVRWAKRLGAHLAGITIIDDLGVRRSGEAAAGDKLACSDGGTVVAESWPKVIENLRECKARFAERCGEAGVTLHWVDEFGSPHIQILLQAQQHDLILLGQCSHFAYGWKEEPDDTVGKVLQDSPRPVVAVPDSLGESDSIVVAYDGSLQAARALLAFESTGLAVGVDVHVVAVDKSWRDAAHRADRAIQFLKGHSIDATAHIVETANPPAAEILKLIQSLNAGLLVMGAYGQPVLREFFLGSATRTLLEESPVPVFCFH
jgi:nucleotide-binding universal stress UspA family protein